jgi:dienelactone hydrolase
VTIGGLVCDGIQDGTVFYPSDAGPDKKYPLLSFAHGWTEGGPSTDPNYRAILEQTAKAGYIVIAHHSGLVTECQPIYPRDQVRALAYMKETAEWAEKIDWDIKTGIYGHSMGGGATGDNAGNRANIDKYNIGAAILIHPVATKTKTLIPSFYMTGTADTICSPQSAAQWYRTATPPSIFAEMRGADHFECQSLEAGIPCPAGWTNYIANWFNCHLKGMQSECDAANSVCTHPTKPMSTTHCSPQYTNATVV